MIPGCVGEPFNIVTDDGTGTMAPTILEIKLTGVNGTVGTGVSVTVGTTVIVANSNTALDLPGFDQVDFTLPSTVDTGDVPIIVTVGTQTSRPDSPPHIKINPGPSPSPSPSPSPT
jgi:uncharacterized protein (TIGR03437 family)